MKAFTKVIMPGRVLPAWRKRAMRVFVEIIWTGERLSIHGVEGPLPSGNSSGSAGQIRLDDVRPADGWNAGMVAVLQKVWDRWHLNDMKAGCWHQRELGWDADKHISKPCPVCSYKYGTAWLSEDVPEHVLEFLAGLPDSPVTPAWV
jgi:hypothetical protein